MHCNGQLEEKSQVWFVLLLPGDEGKNVVWSLVVDVLCCKDLVV